MPIHSTIAGRGAWNEKIGVGCRLEDDGNVAAVPATMRRSVRIRFDTADDDQLLDIELGL
jgi:hypothetical protein